MQALQTDTYATEADLIVPLIAAARAAVGSDPDLDAYVGRDDLGALASEIEAWDRRMDADSGPALASQRSCRSRWVANGRPTMATRWPTGWPRIMAGAAHGTLEPISAVVPTPWYLLVERRGSCRSRRNDRIAQQP